MHRYVDPGFPHSNDSIGADPGCEPVVNFDAAGGAWRRGSAVDLASGMEDKLSLFVQQEGQVRLKALVVLFLSLFALFALN